VLRLEDHQPVWVREGQRLDEPSIDIAVDSGVCADAEGKSQDCGGGESERFAQYAQAEAQILNEILNPIYAARLAAFLFGLLNTTQVEARTAVRLFLRHPLRDVFLGFPFEVVAQLVVQFLVRLRPAKQRPQPQRNREQPMLRSHTPILLTRTSKRPSDRRASRAAPVDSRPPR